MRPKRPVGTVWKRFGGGRAVEGGSRGGGEKNGRGGTGTAAAGGGYLPGAGKAGWRQIAQRMAMAP